MSDIIVRRSGGSAQPSSLARGQFEPFRMMRDLLKFDPFQEMEPVWPAEMRQAVFSPAFEVKETKDSYLFKADVPGTKEQDVEVMMTGNRLTVSGRREEEKEDRGDTYYTCERSYGSFSRSFTLPEGADMQHVHADLKGGVLTIAIPKKPEVQPKKIAVTAEKGAKI
jgi:HSP20 family protein